MFYCKEENNTKIKKNEIRIGIPIKISGLYSFSKSKKHYIETGLGFTFFNENNKTETHQTQILFGSVRLSYRFQKPIGYRRSIC